MNNKKRKKNLLKVTDVWVATLLNFISHFTRMRIETRWIECIEVKLLWRLRCVGIECRDECGTEQNRAERREVADNEGWGINKTVTYPRQTPGTGESNGRILSALLCTTRYWVYQRTRATIRMTTSEKDPLYSILFPLPQSKF